MSQTMMVAASGIDDLKMIRNKLRRKFNRKSLQIRSEYKRAMDEYFKILKVAIANDLPFTVADDYKYELRLVSFAYEKVMMDHLAENVLCDENFNSDDEIYLLKLGQGLDLSRQGNTTLLISILNDLHKHYEPSWSKK